MEYSIIKRTDTTVIENTITGKKKITAGGSMYRVIRDPDNKTNNYKNMGKDFRTQSEAVELYKECINKNKG